ncbi:hypothetical protein BH10BAC4_BH10BAC4_08730 [soil metagenome]
MKIIPMRLLSDKLLEVILLLVGLNILQVIILSTVPLVPIDDFQIRMTFILNASWIGNIIFGFVILWLTRDKGFIAIPIGILSIVLPSYGPVFYILTTLQNKSKND